MIKSKNVQIQPKFFIRSVVVRNEKDGSCLIGTTIMYIKMIWI